MSPIGRVFIVLNVVLAGGFLAVSGTHLQQQHNYKTLYEAEQKAKTEEVSKLQSALDRSDRERQQFENQKTTFETNYNNAQNQIARLNDDIKRLNDLTSSQDATLKKAVALQEAANTEAKAAFSQAKDAYAMAIADQKVKDEAVRAKDTAEAENRTLKTEIAALNATISDRDVKIAGLEKDVSEHKLLVSVARTKGFLPDMAAPNLAGTVMNASGRLCTIQITDNPGNVDIQDQLARGNWRFAIYDETGYKGEAVATKYEASSNAVLCNVFLEKGKIKEGDRAATQTP